MLGFLLSEWWKNVTEKGFAYHARVRESDAVRRASAAPWEREEEALGKWTHPSPPRNGSPVWEKQLRHQQASRLNPPPSFFGLPLPKDNVHCLSAGQ